MKNKLRQWLTTLGYKLGIYRFSARYFANSPRLTRVFNKGLPIAMVAAVVFGLGIISWQIAGLARDGEVRIVSPKGSVNGDFDIKVIYRASYDRNNGFNIVFKLDNKVIKSVVSETIKKGDPDRSYSFDSGINGVDKFPIELLSPGEHTLKVEAKTGLTVGQGASIDDPSVKFTVKDTRNLAALDESVREFTNSQLPLSASPRSAAAPLPGLPQKLAQAVFPKAEAHRGDGKRHGNIKVIASLGQGTPLPGVPVEVSHPALDGCHGPDINSPASPANNKQTTNPSGVAMFYNCPVSNIGGNDAVYTVKVGDTPEGYTIEGVKERNMTVFWNQTREINFIYLISQKAPQPDPTPAPAPANPNPAGGGGPAGNPLILYEHRPSDSEGFIALTKLEAASATVSAFGYQMYNNNGVNYLREVVVYVDGQRGHTITDFPQRNAAGTAAYPTQTGLVLPLPDLNALVADGQKHTLAFQAINGNNKSSILNVTIKNPNVSTGTGGTPAPPEPTTTQPETDKSKPYPETGPQAAGRVVIYSDVTITRDQDIYRVNKDVSFSQASCDGKRFSETKWDAVSFQLNGAKSKEIKCSVGSYFPSPIKGDSYGSGLVVYANYCSYVGSKDKVTRITRVARIEPNGKCPAVADIGPQRPKGKPVLSASLPNGKSSIDKYGGVLVQLTVSLAGGNLSPEKCAGLDWINIVLQGGGGKAPLLLNYYYDKASKNCEALFRIIPEFWKKYPSLLHTSESNYFEESNKIDLRKIL